MDNRKVFSISKHSILNMIIDILVVYCLFKMVTGITTGTEQIYETQRSMYLWRGIMYFCFALLLSIKINYKNHWLWVVALIYFSVAYLFLNRTGYRVNSPTLWAWYTRLWNSVGVVGIVFLDAVFKKKVRKKSNMDLCIMVLLWTSCIGMMVVKNFRLNDTAILGILLGLSIIEIDESEINRLFYGFLIAYYIAFIKMFFESISKVPYMGEERYYGTFTNNGLFGAFAGGATICCIAGGVILHSMGGKARKFGTIISAILSIPSLVAVSIISARVAMLGLVIVGIVLSVVITVRNGRTKLTRGLLYGFALGLLAIVALLFVFYRVVPRDSIGMIKKDYKYIRSTLLFWHDRIGRFFVTDSMSGIIPEGSLWNGVDLFMGGRLSYWLEYSKKMNAFGHLSFVYYIENGGKELILTHPHNTFLGFIYIYGIPFGGMFIITLLLSYRKLIQVIVKKNSNCCMIIFLWITYCFAIYINEDFMLNYFPTFMLLVMQNLVLVGKDTVSISERID